MTQELYKRYRPTKLEDIIGQDAAVAQIKSWGRNGVPHTVLLTGPSGCGKTTIARILKGTLGCSDACFIEVNAAEARGIEMVRDVEQRMGMSPMGGRSRIWLVDECHQLTGAAQGAFLKILEDTPSHVYFFLATTDPQKLLPTIKTRATTVQLELLDDTQIKDLLVNTCKAEGIKISPAIGKRLVAAAKGSARKALVLLNQIMALDSEEKQIEAIEQGDPERQAIEIARALMDKRTTWSQMAAILKGVSKDAETESMRHLVLGYCTTVLLNNGKDGARAAFVIEEFADNFFDTKRAGLVRACYAVIQGET